MIDFKIIGHRLSWTTVDGWFTYLIFVILSDACFTLHMNKLNHPINPHRPKCPKIRSANNILMVFVFFLRRTNTKCVWSRKVKWQIIYSVCPALCMVLFKINENYWRWSLTDAKRKQKKVWEKRCYLKRHPRWALSISVFTVHCSLSSEACSVESPLFRDCRAAENEHFMVIN